ncbi:MAG: hypothetical protein DRJ49_01320 [Thermoprotei archaeon]|nr:MAG: hypothetical protein DRJ49_01320 [Thermoprotei archaeon]
MPRKILSISEALASPIRRQIVLYLLENPGSSFNKLSRRLNIGLGNLYSHILILSRVGLIRFKKSGCRTFLYVNTNLLINNKNSKKHYS